MFSPKFFQDLLLKNSTQLDAEMPVWETHFIGIGTAFFCKYIALNFGLGGLTTPKTPTQLIEGYTDPHIDYFVTKPVYMGGNAKINSFIKVDPPNA